MIALILAAVVSQSYTPQEASGLFTEANDAYFKEDYAGAISRYEKLLEAGQGGTDVLFNLGTAHLAKGEIGPGVLYLERARRISRDDDIEANLALARQKQVDQVIGAELEEPFFQRVAGAINVTAVGVAFLVCWWLGFILLWAWRRAESARLVIGLLSAALLLAGVALGATLGIHAWVSENVIEAVIIPDTVKVHEAPADNAKVSFEAHAGLKVRIVETSGKFVRVRLPNALEGWAEKEGLVEL